MDSYTVRYERWLRSDVHADFCIYNWVENATGCSKLAAYGRSLCWEHYNYVRKTYGGVQSWLDFVDPRSASEVLRELELYKSA